MKTRTMLILNLIFTLWLGTTAHGAITVGRIAYVEGRIYRFTDVDRSWVETTVQSPAGTLDVLSTGDGSRAELAFPDYVTVRLDRNAEIEILDLEEAGFVFALPAGLARFSNRSAATGITVQTVTGRVLVGPKAAVDVQVAADSVIVAVVDGQATFQTTVNGVETLEVLSGGTSLEFREESIFAGRSPVNLEWDIWCEGRESVLARNRVIYTEYLPASMQEYAGVLEGHGDWNRIYYGGYNYWAWKPRYVAVDWSPYTAGYWFDWHGSSVWVDNNPWGWVTHHHGHWIQVHGSWMWVPYVHVAAVPGVTVIGRDISFGNRFRPYWHPGRVRWITYDDYIGWLPLSPWETYYGTRIWGPRSAVAHGGAGFSIRVDLTRHSYIDHAVVIPKRYLHQRGPVTVSNYNTVRITGISKTKIIKNYKPISSFDDHRRKRSAAAIKGPGKADHGMVQSPGERRASGVTDPGRNTMRNNDPAGRVQKKGRQRDLFTGRERMESGERPGTPAKRKAPGIKEKAPIKETPTARRSGPVNVENQLKNKPERRTAAKKRPESPKVPVTMISADKTAGRTGMQASAGNSQGQENRTASLRPAGRIKDV